jgi:predicted glycogen debranching enzyme
VEGSGSWYYNFEYDRERERGLDFREDLFSPFLLHFDCSVDRQPVIVASLADRVVTQAGELRAREIERRARLIQGAPHPILANAADQFLVDRGGQKSIIAGYPWFSDWGRDTMISLPGLTLVTGRYEDARSILLAFAACIDRGMLPNRFPDAGEQPEYNTVDATLWMFHAVHELLRYTGDFFFVRQHLYERLVDVIAWHERGTRYGIKLDSDGLLRAGETGVQLTWMDAKVGDWVVTPRHGKPVEIQALWYNALCVMEQLATAFEDHDRSRAFAVLALRARESFPRAFWNPTERCLHDVLGDTGPDAAIRPNQIFAVSLPYTMLEPAEALAVVETVERELLTPYGLRTLSPRDSHYRGRFDGDMTSRDAAYHQGTVWPWLIGPFLTARVKTRGNSVEARTGAAELLRPLHQHLSEAGLGQISEVFDGDAPHRPGGCIAQAWSVAEVLRALVEDVEGRLPDALAARTKP